MPSFSYTDINVSLPSSFPSSSVQGIQVWGLTDGGNYYGNLIFKAKGSGNGIPEGFISSLSNNSFNIYNAPTNSSVSTITGMSDQGILVGGNLPQSPIYTIPYIYQNLQYNLNPPISNPIGIDNAGTIVGSQAGSGAVYSNNSLQIINVPLKGATQTIWTAVSGNELVGSYTGSDNQTHGVSYSNNQFNYFDYNGPYASNTTLTGVNSWGEIVGEYLNQFGQHGAFYYANNQYYALTDSRITNFGGVDQVSINNKHQITITMHNYDQNTGLFSYFNDLVQVGVKSEVPKSAQADYIYKLYEGLFSRAPDSAGFAAWTNSKDPTTSILDQFLASSEFNAVFNMQKDNKAFVDSLYTQILHRQGSSNDVSYSNE